MKNYQINSVQSVEEFLYDVYAVSRIPFDPADDLTKLKREDGSLLFPTEEGSYLDGVMMECFLFCIYNNISINTVAEVVQAKIFHTKKVA